jgi:hypothetical protein
MYVSTSTSTSTEHISTSASTTRRCGTIDQQSTGAARALAPMCRGWDRGRRLVEEGRRTADRNQAHRVFVRGRIAAHVPLPRLPSHRSSCRTAVDGARPCDLQARQFKFRQRAYPYPSSAAPSPLTPRRRSVSIPVEVRVGATPRTATRRVQQAIRDRRRARITAGRVRLSQITVDRVQEEAR